MHTQINYILHTPLSRQYILRHSIQAYKPINNHLNAYGVLQFTIYFYKYCLILHRTVITVLEIRKLTRFSDSWSNVLSTTFLLAFITVPFASEQRPYNCKLSDNIYSTVIWFCISILSLYDGLDQFSYF